MRSARDFSARIDSHYKKSQTLAFGPLYSKNAEFYFQLIQIAPVTSGLASHILLAVEAVAFPKSLGC